MPSRDHQNAEAAPRHGYSPITSDHTPPAATSASPTPPEGRLPGVSDRACRRYRIFRFDFDSRALFLGEQLQDSWDEEAKARWRENDARRIDELKAEYGKDDLDRKLADFRDFGVKPFSIIAHHNQLFEQVRTAFVSGAYYAALTAACALGERILNHLILDLRDSYRSTPEYRSVYRKSSFAAWTVVIDTLEAWGVLQPTVVDEFRRLEVLRNRSIHFNPETVGQLRADALQAIRYLQAVITGQFAGFGPQPWFIEGVLGAGFVKRDWESDPFVRHYYLPGNVCVGPFHDLAPTPSGPWQFVDHPDYGAFGIDGLTDEQFKDVFNERPTEALARLPSAVATEAAKP